MAHPLRPASENADPLFSVVDDDDVPFCVVCTGEECVCGAVVAAGHASRVAHLADSTPSAYSPRLSSPVAGPSSSKHIPTLKIKLPAGLLSKARASSSSTHVRSDRKSFDAKRLARPAKLDASARKVKSTLLTKTKAPSRLPARPPLAKKSAALKKKRKNRAAVPWENSESELTDIDAAMLDAFEDDPNDYLPVSTNLPTFMPASFVSAAAVASSPVESSDSDSDSSLTAGFGSDDSMQAEEEDFITGQRHKDRARVKKDGSDDPRPRVQNNWEIKPRMRSVDLEDDMDVDSGEETEAEDDEVDEEETEDDKQEDWGSRRPVATTWSDGEESEIDADLFFANLGSDGSTSSSDENMPEDAPVSPTSPTVPAPTGLALGSLFPFDTTHGWEAEVTLPDLDNLPIFVDADLACFLEPNEESSPSDVDEGPFVSFSDGCERDDEDDGGEDDGAWSDEDAGATTDEDLVDAHGLPTARAMALFKMPVAPVSLAAVAPLATVSPYVPRVDIKARTSFAPAEILAGRGDLDMDGDSDEHDHDGLVTRRARSASWSVSRGGVRFPRMGRFGSSASRQAVIDGKTEDVPSPFARRAPSLRRNRVRCSPRSLKRRADLLLTRHLKAHTEQAPLALVGRPSAVSALLSTPRTSRYPHLRPWSTLWLHQSSSTTSSIRLCSPPTRPRRTSPRARACGTRLQPQRPAPHPTRISPAGTLCPLTCSGTRTRQARTSCARPAPRHFPY
jgi:hypothetical protein